MSVSPLLKANIVALCIIASITACPQWPSLDRMAIGLGTQTKVLDRTAFLHINYRKQFHEEATHTVTLLVNLANFVTKRDELRRLELPSGTEPDNRTRLVNIATALMDAIARDACEYVSLP